MVFKNYIAWIPARGGSKRLPKKNSLIFCGKPLIFYSIDVAKRCPSIDSVYVSTDDPEIADLSRQFGAEVIMRPDALASDTASTGSAARHLLDELGISKNDQLKGLITLQPTQPLRTASLLESCIQEFERVNAYALLTVSLNRHKLGRIQNGVFKTITYKPEQRSQDVEPLYFEDGVVYITKPELILEKGVVFDDGATPFIIPDIYSRIDIDDQLDFDIGEFIFMHEKDLINEFSIR